MNHEPITSDGTISQVSMRDALATAPSIIAIAGVYGLAISFCYEYAFLTGSDNSWALQYLAVTDYLDRALLPGIVAAFLAVVFGFAWYFYIRRSEQRYGTVRRRLIILSVLTPIAVVLVFVLASRSTFFAASRLYWIWICFLVASMVGIYWRIPRGRKQDQALLIVAAILPLGAAVVYGDKSARRFRECPASIHIQYSEAEGLNGDFYISTGHGVMMSSAKSGEVHLIPWDRVVSVTSKPCRAPLPQR